MAIIFFGPAREQTTTLMALRGGTGAQLWIPAARQAAPPGTFVQVSSLSGAWGFNQTTAVFFLNGGAVDNLQKAPILLVQVC
jgi:hypothetical protein